ncbi:MAG: hypothetical protein HY537_07430 [Deltaproteobacteria bacterium]|nr:hypothetical protein [Deltaproteobacteria bacterium]
MKTLKLSVTGLVGLILCIGLSSNTFGNPDDHGRASGGDQTRSQAEGEKWTKAEQALIKKGGQYKTFAESATQYRAKLHEKCSDPKFHSSVSIEKGLRNLMEELAKSPQTVDKEKVKGAFVVLKELLKTEMNDKNLADALASLEKIVSELKISVADDTKEKICESSKPAELCVVFDELKKDNCNLSSAAAETVSGTPELVAPSGAPIQPPPAEVVAAQPVEPPAPQAPVQPTVDKDKNNKKFSELGDALKSMGDGLKGLLDQGMAGLNDAVQKLSDGFANDQKAKEDALKAKKQGEKPEDMLAKAEEDPMKHLMPIMDALKGKEDGHGKGKQEGGGDKGGGGSGEQGGGKKDGKEKPAYDPNQLANANQGQPNGNPGGLGGLGSSGSSTPISTPTTNIPTSNSSKEIPQLPPVQTQGSYLSQILPLLMSNPLNNMASMMGAGAQAMPGGFPRVGGGRGMQMGPRSAVGGAANAAGSNMGVQPRTKDPFSSVAAAK